jgi:hypothetical protein
MEAQNIRNPESGFRNPGFQKFEKAAIQLELIGCATADEWCRHQDYSGHPALHRFAVVLAALARANSLPANLSNEFELCLYERSDCSMHGSDK